MPDTISDIYESADGKPYKTKILHSGPKVESRAVLIGARNSSVSDGLVLKLGRYKKGTQQDRKKGIPEFSQPKSEVSLRPEETETFLVFLEQYAGLVRAGKGSYIQVDDEDVLASLSSLKRLLEGLTQGQLEEFLRDESSLAEELVGLATRTTRRREFNKLEVLVNENARESAFQQWFASNDWVFGVESSRFLEARQIDVNRVADFLTIAEDGYVDVIELKRPGHSPWATNRDHGNLTPSRELTVAITQAQNYLFALEQEMKDKKTLDRIGFPIAKPRSLLIMGRSQEWGPDEFQAQRLLNAGLVNVQLLTFDQILSRTRRLIS